MSISLYKQAYEKTKDELSGLLVRRDQIEKRIVVLRKNVEGLAALCETEGVSVTPSREAQYILDTAGMAAEIEAVLKSHSPSYMRPGTIRDELAGLGHKMSEYQNALATVQAVLKRMVEAGNVEEDVDKDGKKIYRWLTLLDKVRAYAAGKNK